MLPFPKGSRETPVRGGAVRCRVNSEGYLYSGVKSGGLGPLGPSLQDKGTRAAAFSHLFSLRCYGAGSVSTSSQQLPRRPVLGSWDPSWDSPTSRCSSAWGSEEVPASAHSDQQVQCGDGAEKGLVGGGGSQCWVSQQILSPSPTSGHRNLLREEELRSTSLPSIPNPFPELCSPPSQTPILGGSSGARGLLPRDASCPHVSCLGREKAGIWGCYGTEAGRVPPPWRGEGNSVRSP